MSDQRNNHDEAQGATKGRMNTRYTSLEELPAEARAKVEAARRRRRTPEGQAEEQSVRQRYADRPTLGELEARGEIDPVEGVPHGAALELVRLIAALRARREALGISLDDVARRSGIAPAALSRLENHKTPNPTWGTLARYAYALGNHLAWTVESGEPQPTR